MNEFIQQYFELIVEANKNRSISRKLNTHQMRLDWQQLNNPIPPVQDLTCGACMFRFLGRIEHECRNYIEIQSERNGRKQKSGNKGRTRNAPRTKRGNSGTNTSNGNSRD